MGNTLEISIFCGKVTCCFQVKVIDVENNKVDSKCKMVVVVLSHSNVTKKWNNGVVMQRYDIAMMALMKYKMAVEMCDFNDVIWVIIYKIKKVISLCGF